MRVRFPSGAQIIFLSLRLSLSSKQFTFESIHLKTLAESLRLYVHTNPFSCASVFDPPKTDTNIRVHTSYEKTIRFRSPRETDYRVHDVSVFETGGVFARPHQYERHPFSPWSPPWKASVFVGQGMRFPSYWCGRSAKTHTKVCVFQTKTD